MKTAIRIGVLLSSAALSQGALLSNRNPSVSGTATVSLSKPSGHPEHLASGMIYGIPATPNQIPAQFYDEIGFRWNLAGAAQTPTTGWLGSEEDFEIRFQDVLGEYRTTLEHGGQFQLRISDLWGADGGETSSDPFPGDNGNWTSYDLFLEAVIHDIYKNKIQHGLSIEIWNEPDGTWFWKRSQSQYFEMWSRGLETLRKAFGPQVPLIGPSFAYPPGEPDSWWDAFLSFMHGNYSIPDVFTWHAEQFDPSNIYGDPQEAAAALTSLLAKYSLPLRPFCINEYGQPAEQQPAGAAWFISRLERLNIPGLRGNWAGGYALHDYLANLLGKPGADTAQYNSTGGVYWPNGEWRVYQYYATNMTGQRVATAGSPDRLFDVYATSDGTQYGVKILCGPRLAEGTWAITVDGLTQLGHPYKGEIPIRTLRFDFNGTYGEAGLPVDMGVTTHQYEGDSLTWTVTPATNQTAYAFEFVDHGM